MRLCVISLGGESSKNIAKESKEFFDEVVEVNLKHIELCLDDKNFKIKDGIKDLESGETQLSWNDTKQVGATAPNPDCQEGICVESFWVTENNLCLYCGYRG